MGQWDVRLLTASYRKVGNEQLAIEMFGKTDDGRSITIRYVGFEPYLYIMGPTKDIVEELKKDKNVRRVEETELFYKGSTKRALKIVVMYPWLVPDFRTRLKKSFEVLAADIPFHHRFIYDFDIGSCLRVKGEESEGQYTTDLVVNMTGFENIPPFNPDLKILSFDIESSVRDNTILTICYVLREDGELKHGKPLFGSEKEIIEAFSKIIEEEDPDVITGYNIDNYDIPAIVERGKLAGIKELRWGRDLSDPKRIGVRGWRLTGRLIADAWWCAKMQLRPKQETLNHVAKLVLGEQKLDVDPSKLDEEWAADKDKVMRYCSKDAELALKILENVGTLRRTMDLASVSKLPVDDVLSSGTSQLIDSILIRAADRAHVGVPLTGGFEDEEETYEGGYVHTIEPGLYHWVCVLDFKSMYPSLIIAKNICFTTMNPLGDIVSPTGVHFLSKDQREGLLPHILEDLMKERDDIKRKMKRAETPEECRYCDGLQNAVKILMNAVYGVFGTTFYRFTDRNISSSITAFAREATQTVIKNLEGEGYNVIYGDTDSLFVQSPFDKLDATVDFGNKLAERFSKEVSQMEFQKVLNPLFSHGKKKRYVGRSVWPNEELLIRGYEMRRTDSFDLQSEVLMEVFELVLDEKPEEAVKLARSKVDELLECKVPVEKLVISRTCKSFNSYKDPDSQVNVQAARKLMALGYEFVPGMKVSWVVTNSKKRPQEVQPYVSGRKFDGQPDCKYYAERLAQSVGRATEVFGWGEKDLMTGSQQFTLFDQSFGSANVKEKPKKKTNIKKNDKKMSLQDFM